MLQIFHDFSVDPWRVTHQVDDAEEQEEAQYSGNKLKSSRRDLEQVLGERSQLLEFKRY